MIKIATAECFTHGKIGLELHALAQNYEGNFGSRYIENISGYGNFDYNEISVICSLFIPTIDAMNDILNVKNPPEPDYLIKGIKVYDEVGDKKTSKVMAKAVMELTDCDIAIGTTAGIGHGAVTIITKITKIYEIMVYASILMALVNAAHELYNSFESSKLKPIEGLVQVIKGVIIAVSVLLITTFLLGKSLSSIIIGLGTISAVLLLIFQDSIKGFVGSIQLSINDMLRIGDWIVVGQADGTVQEINLTSVKVQNWDNTITTIPTYTLVSAPFTNWRGMSESGGRRIARSINIDVNTIRYCTPEMLEKYKHYSLVKDYIAEKEEDILEYNKSNNIDTSEIMNGRQQTNLGIFRAYIKAYLNNNPKLNHNLTMMVRQLQPTEFGVPLQIYAFSSDKQWTNYEEIQSDIFDHIISAAPMFDLKIYQKH